ncbi:hypothetical protein M758_11G080000, partial [Ceratodon purpureus]
QNPRNRKCTYTASGIVSHIMRVLQGGFSAEEKRLVVHRCFADDRMREVDPQLCSTVKNSRQVAVNPVQSLRGALQTIRSTCIQGKAKKTKERCT